MQSNIEENVIAIFRDKGFERHEQLTQEISRRVIDEHCQNVLYKPFDNEMMVEFLSQCRCSKLEITPKGLGEVIREATEILASRLQILQGRDGLILKKRQSLQKIDAQAKAMSLSRNQAFYERQHMNQLQKQFNEIQIELRQLETNQKTFLQQYLLLDELFRKHVPDARNKKPVKNVESTSVLNPKNLTNLFYFSVLGLIAESLVLQLRPGCIGIAVFLQGLFLVLIGYHQKKAVMFLTLTGLTSILLDLATLFFYEFFQFSHNYYQNREDNIYYITKIARKVFLVLSILLRISSIISAYPYMDPPLQKIQFQICSKTLTLNTRLRPGIAPTAYRIVVNEQVE